MRELSPKEKQVYEIIASKLKLEPIQNLKSVGLNRRQERFIMNDPISYKVKGTDTVVIFGNMSQGYDIKKLQEQLVKLQASLDAQKTMEEEKEEETKEYKEEAQEINEEEKNTEGMKEETKNTSEIIREIESTGLTEIITNDLTSDLKIHDDNFKTSGDESILNEIPEEKVQLIISQAGVSREKALKALIESDGDVLKALEKLTE